MINLTNMKTILLLLFIAFIINNCSSKGYLPAFEADHVFKTEVEKWTYLSTKYHLPLFYHDACDEDSTIEVY